MQRLFLVDTGATVSVFPHHTSGLAATCLRGANRQSIPSWGQRTLPLSLASFLATTNHLEWSFMLALVERPIIGVDFLCHHQLEALLAIFLSQ